MKLLSALRQIVLSLELSIPPAKPFVKWVGGKRSVVNELQRRMPVSFDGYHEAFAGGGALFFATQSNPAHLSDANLHLILTYRAIRDDLGAVIAELAKHQKNHKKEYYLKARKALNSQSDCVKIAALFIYLNKTCFNGLYRVNKAGEFNVPMGSYKNPNILDEENLNSVSRVLQGVELVHHGFEHTPIKKGAFYYVDPPYHQTYSGYGSAGFADKAHQQLADFCHQIDKIGGYFMLSNSNTDFINKIYNKYCIEKVSALRSVSCKANQRGREDECIIRNYQ